MIQNYIEIKKLRPKNIANGKIKQRLCTNAS